MNITMVSPGAARRILFALLALLPAAPGAASGQGAPAATPAKVYELRVYTAVEGKMPALMSRFRDHTLRIFEKHGMENVAYWTTTEAPQGIPAENTLVYILAHRDREAARRSWAAFGADPEWREVAARSEANGPLLAGRPASMFMSSTDFDPALLSRGDRRAVAPLYELRLYRGGTALQPTVQRFRDWERDVFARNGLQTLDFWTANDSSAFVYVLAHRDRETARANWARFTPDFRAEMAKRRPAAPAAAPAAGQAAASPPAPPAPPVPGAVRLGTYFLVPADFSPLK